MSEKYTPPARCLKCEAGRVHPWHDDGTRNKWQSPRWELNGSQRGPTMDSSEEHDD